MSPPENSQQKAVEESRDDAPVMSLDQEFRKVQKDVKVLQESITEAKQDLTKGFVKAIEVAKRKVIDDTKVLGQRIIRKREEAFERKITRNAKVLEESLRRDMKKQAEEIKKLTAIVEQLKGQAPVIEAGGGGRVDGARNTTNLQTQRDVERSTIEDPEGLLDKVWDQMKDAENHYLVGVFFIGAIILSGFTRSMIPCGGGAIFLLVAVPILLLLFAASSIWKIHCVQQADSRREVYIKHFTTAYLVHMLFIGGGALVVMVVFGVTAVMRNCRNGKLIQTCQCPQGI